MTSSPFLNDIRRFMRTRGYSLRTEKTYVYWIRFFHTDVATTQIYTHVIGQHFAGTESPMDRLMM